MRSPYAYPSAHQDVLNALTQSGAAANDMASAKRQSDMGQQAGDFARRYALQSMQNQIEGQSQRNNLMQNRMDGLFGPTGSLLRGLYE